MSRAHVEAALRQAERRLDGRLVEPLAAYAITEPLPGLIRAYSGTDAVPADGIRVEGARNCLVSGFGASLRIPRGLRIRGEGNTLFLGAHADVASADILIEGDDNLVCFGAFATTGGVTVRIRGSGLSIVVGERCMIAPRVILGALDPIALYALDTRRRVDAPGDIVIGEHCWLAREVCVEPGSTIGAETIVGQGSVVRGAHPDGTILVGAPAKPRAVGVTWGRTKHLSLDALEASSDHEKTYLRPLRALLARVKELRDPATIKHLSLDALEASSDHEKTYLRPFRALLARVKELRDPAAIKTPSSR